MIKRAHFIAIGILGAMSFLYIVLGVKFAETNLQFSFLNFPIFVGEIALFFSAAFFLFYIFQAGRVSGNRSFDLFVALYVIFILLKALYGYIQYGPLALRHAALFYYPLAALITYCSLARFTSWNVILKSLLPIILALFCLQKFSEYWFFGFSVLALAGVLQFKDKKVRFILGAILILIIPYKTFFLTSRMMIVGNIAGAVFLAVCFFLILNWPKRIKLVSLGVIIFIVVAGFIKTSAVTSASSIINFKEITRVFKENDQYIQSEKQGFTTSLSKNVRLYRPNVTNHGIDGAETKVLLRTIEREMDSIVQENKEIKEESKERVESKEVEKQFVLPILSDDIVGRIYYYDDYLNDLASQVKNGVKFLPRTELNKVTELGEKIDVIYEKNREIMTVMAAQSGKEISPVYKNYVMVAQKIDNMRTNINTIKNNYKENVLEDGSVNKEIDKPSNRNESVAVVNAVFRLFIWRDMLEEVIHFRPALGFSFGRPLRSVSLEICGWGTGEWARDGWIEAHNSYFNVIYRAGLLGVMFILFFVWSVIGLIRSFIHHRDLVGILLTSIIVNWMVAANFLPIFELPYHSIPIWVIVGLTFAYREHLISLTNKKENE